MKLFCNIDFQRQSGIVNQAFVLKICFLYLFIAGIDCSPAYAQFGNLEKGDRIRISTPVVEPYRITGTVSILEGSVVAVSVKDSLVYVSESLVQNVEISTGKKRVPGRGLLIGAVTGTVLVGLFAAFTNDACGFKEDCFLASTNGDAFIRGGAFGLILGGVAGGITGSFIRIDRWEHVPVGIAMDVTPSYPDQKALEPKLSFQISF